MNRPIKFRAWDKNNKKFESCSIGEFVIIIQPKTGEWETMNLEEFHQRFEVSQFTGLLDRNGKEIYEGDIVKRPHQFDKPIIKVEWSNFRSGWSINSGRQAEIIGNIYENPEFLKGEK